MKKAIVTLSFILLSICTYSQEEYKIGVNLFRLENGPIATQAVTGKTLDSIVASITANQPNRTVAGKKVKLVISLDVSWAWTETSPGVYNFEWYKSFAELCEQKGITWTPLLAPHYVPNFILSDPNSQYADHKINYVDGTPLGGFNFLPYSPSSPIWNNEVADWIKAFINAMVDSNHITTFPWNQRAIDEILVGNEMIYPFNEATSGDAATKERWVNDGNSINDYPTTTQQFINEWYTFDNFQPNLLRDFRNKELAYCIAGMMHVVKSQLGIRLGQTSANNIGVSSKLVPYMFPRVESNGFPGTSKSDEFCGYDEAQIGYLIEQSNKFLAVDIYTAPYVPDYGAASNRLAASGKSIYLAEFNKAGTDAESYIPLTTSEIYNYGKAGFDFHNLKYYVYFAWNPTGSDNFLKINEAQQLGLYNLFNKLAPIVNPVESNIPNNFASGAYSIPSYYDNSTDHEISITDVDWYKFIHDRKTYYLKVIQKTNMQNTITPKRYGLRLTSNIFAITAKTYQAGNGEIDTELFLYDENLVQLESNDDDTNTKFSKLSHSLFSFPSPILSKNSSQNDPNSLKQFDILISPNPTKDYINISLEGGMKNQYYSISIKDTNNKTIFEDKRSLDSYKQIDLSRVANGIYFVIIETNENHKIIKKIIKR